MNKARNIYEVLKKTYPDAKCALLYKTPFQLLIATLLSAQATDVSVNKVTTELYKEYPDLESFLTLDLEEIEKRIKSIGLYKNKAKNIYQLCRVLRDNFNGIVPNAMEELITLPGVGRKTASVVLSEGFKIPAFPVDTHVFRVTKRLGIAKENTADKVSDEIMKKLPKKTWLDAHHIIIAHGRSVCTARSPKCNICTVNNLCNYKEKEN